MSELEKLEPPKGVPITDPGAHELVESSDSEDQFTDAQSAPMSPPPSSPIPKTRVEKIDDEPSYGEVPGTEAYAKREQDALPDEIALVNQDTISHKSASSINTTVPTTLVEESPGGTPKPHSAKYEEEHKVDASPDVVLDSEGHVKAMDGEDNNENLSSPPTSPIEQALPEDSSSQDRLAPLAPPVEDSDEEDEEEDEEEGKEKNEEQEEQEKKEEEEEEEEEREEEEAEQEQDDIGNGDDFGDDFDDFEEGNEDEDFDDFDDDFQQAETIPATVPNALPPQPQLPFPIPDFDGLDTESILSSTDPYLAGLFPPEELDFPSFPPLPKDSTIFQTPRSASLWSQLVAPPPLAPPDWIRSRIRRLFLVSLGVPVDLDEILPASKQKKLVLPSLNLTTGSSRTSSDSRSVSRLRHGEGNTSSTSIDTQGKPSKKRRGPPPQPELDLVAARHLCMTTDEALNGMTDEELKAHVSKLEAMESVAKEALEYWKKRTDEKIGDREAFEGVIENLVKHARKVRK